MNKLMVALPLVAGLLTGCGWLPTAQDVHKAQDEIQTTMFLAQARINNALIYAADNYTHDFIPGHVIVAYRQGTTSANVARLLTGVGARIVSPLFDPRAGPQSRAVTSADRVVSLVTLGDSSRQGVLDAITRLKANPYVEYVEPDYLITATAIPPNDPLYPQLWGLGKIKANDAWVTDTGSPTVVVGVVDSGIDYNHADLAANMWKNPGEIAGNGVDDDQNGYVDDVYGWNFFSNTNDPMDNMSLDKTYHGTHVAGTIAAAGDNGIGVAGVSWNAKLVALKFLGSEGSGPSSGAILAINYAIKMHIPILNNSWGGSPYTQSLYDAITNAGNAGILFVVAAGNSSRDNDALPSYPSSYDNPNLISVAASDLSDNLAYFSEWGLTSVDLAAPGVNILSTTTADGYQYLSGTSMAAPMVSGAAALLKAWHPTDTAVQLKAAILGSVDLIPALSTKVVSGGRLNLAAMLLAVTP